MGKRETAMNLTATATEMERKQTQANALEGQFWNGNECSSQ
jgi:hypothetical protein